MVEVRRIPEGVSGFRQRMCADCGQPIPADRVHTYLERYDDLPDLCAECDRADWEYEPKVCHLCLEEVEHDHICAFCAEVYAVCVVASPGHRCACGGIIHRVDITSCTDCKPLTHEAGL